MGLGFCYHVDEEKSVSPPFNKRASWSYSGFNSFRNRLVKTYLGSEFCLKDFYGFGGTKQFDEFDDLTPFLSHSDCDGEISVQDMKRVAPALKKVIDLWTDIPHDYDKETANNLIDFMYECIKVNRPLSFV